MSNKIEVQDNSLMKGAELEKLIKGAKQILVTNATRQKYASGYQALYADPITPDLPTTIDAATPNILVVGPFQDESDLVSIAIYVGIGLIDTRNENERMVRHVIRPLDGEGMDVRSAWLNAALRLYFGANFVETGDA